MPQDQSQAGEETNERVVEGFRAEEGRGMAVSIRARIDPSLVQASEIGAWSCCILGIHPSLDSTSSFLASNQ